MKPTDWLAPSFTLGEFFTTRHNAKLLWEEFLALPTEEQQLLKTNLQCLANRLQVLRDILGEPITIVSGWRSKRVNALSGGASGSLHMQGKACDVTLSGAGKISLERLTGNWSGGRGLGKGIFHLDIGEKRRWEY